MKQRLVVAAAVLVLAAAGLSFSAPAESAGVVPAITALSAMRGESVGGTQIVITGRHFSKKSVALFGTARGYQLAVLSSTRLRVRAPKHKAGEVNVRVRTGAGTSKIVKNDRFAFVDPPVISKLSSRTSTPSGGATLTIIGANFVGVRQVTFTSAPATHVRLLSSRELSVTVPAHQTGRVAVRVLAAGGLSKYTNADLFTYAEPANPVTDVLAPPHQPGAKIYDTACTTQNTCYAVGDLESQTTDQPLVETLRRPGGVWTSTTLSLPQDAGGPPLGGALRAVSCPTATDCYAVGSYVTQDDAERPLLEHFSDSVRQPIQVALPQGTTDGQLTEIACPTATMCAMSGSATESAHSSGEFLATYRENDGTTAVLAPAPDGATASNLDPDSLACASSSLCVFVASVSNQSSGGGNATSDVLSGSTWTSSDVPAPSSDASSWFLQSVACRSASTCVAVGASITQVSQTGRFAPLISTFTAGGGWTSMTAPTPAGYVPNNDGSNILNAVSCAASFCEAVGSIQVGNNPWAGLIERSTAGSSWTPTTEYGAVDTRTDLTEVACASSAFCTATGGTWPSENSAPSIAALTHSNRTKTYLIPLPKDTTDSVTAYSLSCAPLGKICAGIGILSNSGDRTLLTFS